MKPSGVSPSRGWLTSPGRRVCAWVLLVVLCMVTLWFLNLTLANYWAAGGPPTPNPELYRSRGNTFLLLSAISLVVVGAVAYQLLRAYRDA